ncbi:hypothetical protein L0Y59_02180 [Candidatus Uhrbacteria bacterium]|nr:hypothetical protein [Candidatus Uhrbacteria bacterium]
MLQRHLVSSLLFASLVLVGAGCGPSAPAPSDTTSGTGPSISDSCGNPYYPFKPGLVIAYRVTPAAGPEGSSDYAIRTVSVSGSTATIRAELANGATADMTADCADGTVALKGSSGLGAAMEGTTFTMTPVSSSGTSMPANVTAGTNWENTEEVRMEFTDDANAGIGPITMTTTERSKAIGEESVTVPAGTFKAMKVELKRTISSVAAFGAMPPSTDTVTEWWVKGIGMIKSVTIGQDGTSTVEATSVTGQ